MTDLADYLGTKSGERALIVGRGESSRGFSLPSKTKAFAIVINDSESGLSEGPDPEYLLAQDGPDSFDEERRAAMTETKAVLFFTPKHKDVHRKWREIVATATVVPYPLRSPNWGVAPPNGTHLHYGKTSIYPAIALADHLGARKIGLIGVDFTGDHFFTTRARWLDDKFSRYVEALGKRGVEIVNLSTVSLLRCVPRSSWENFFDE